MVTTLDSAAYTCILFFLPGMWYLFVKLLQMNEYVSVRHYVQLTQINKNIEC